EGIDGCRVAAVATPRDRSTHLSGRTALLLVGQRRAREGFAGARAREAAVDAGRCCTSPHAVPADQAVYVRPPMSASRRQKGRGLKSAAGVWSRAGGRGLHRSGRARLGECQKPRATLQRGSNGLGVGTVVPTLATIQRKTWPRNYAAPSLLLV